LGVGARSAAAAPFRLLQVLEVDRGEGRRQTRRIRRSKFDEAKLQRFGQPAGSVTLVLYSTNMAENTRLKEISMNMTKILEMLEADREENKTRFETLEVTVDTLLKQNHNTEGIIHPNANETSSTVNTTQ